MRKSEGCWCQGGPLWPAETLCFTYPLDRGQRVHSVRFGVHCPPCREVLHPLVRDLDASTILLVDGAEQLSKFDWLRLSRASRQSAGLLITTHRAGWLPMVHEHTTSAALLRTLVADLASPQEASRLVDPSDRLFQTCGGNLRDALRALYDEVADHVTDEPSV
jgi:hypothetical protein